MLDQVKLEKIILTIAHTDNDISTAAAHCLQNICTSISDIEEIKKEREKYEAARKADSACKLRPFPFVGDKIGEFIHLCCIDASWFTLTFVWYSSLQ